MSVMSIMSSFSPRRSPAGRKSSAASDGPTGNAPPADSEDVLLPDCPDIDEEMGLASPSPSPPVPPDAPEDALLPEYPDSTGEEMDLSLSPPLPHEPSDMDEEQALERTQKLLRTMLKELLGLSVLQITLAIAVLINILFIRRATEPLSENPSLIAAVASAFIALLSGFGLMFDTMKQLMIGHQIPDDGDSGCSFSKFFLCVSKISLVFTVVSVVFSFLPRSYYFLPVILVPTLPVLAIYTYDIHLMNDDDSGLPGNVNAGDRHKACRKRAMQLTLTMTTFSFIGALGTVIGYHKNSSNQSASHAYVEVSIYFMLAATLTGLVTLLLNRLLGMHGWKKTVFSNTIMLVLLVASELLVSATFLKGTVAATLFPPAIAAVVWYVREHHVPSGNNVREDLKSLYTLALQAMSVSFGAVMAIFVGFLGGVADGRHLNVSVFLVASCFMSSVSLAVVTFRPPEKPSIGAAAKVLAYLIIALLLLAMPMLAAVVSYAG